MRIGAEDAAKYGLQEGVLVLESTLVGTPSSSQESPAADQHSPSQEAAVSSLMHLLCPASATSGTIMHISRGFWAAWYNTWLLVKLTPTGVAFSFLLFSILVVWMQSLQKQTRQSIILLSGSLLHGCHPYHSTSGQALLTKLMMHCLHAGLAKCSS